MFTGYAAAVTDEISARELARTLRAALKNARHVVFAFRTGEGQIVREGMSDDGEPHGTAGMPLLTLLRHRDHTDVLVAVSRVYGGVHLGPGNLKRAYVEAAQSALDLVFPRVEKSASAPARKKK